MTNSSSAKSNPLIAAIAESLKRKATEMQQQAQEQAQERNALTSSQVSGGLSKPDRQEIDEKGLCWSWEGPGNVLVEASYSKENKDYVIRVSTPETDFDLTSHESKTLGEMLLSACQWEQVWQTHVGEFLV